MISHHTYLKAVNHTKNVNRWYSLRVGQDLFGEWILITQWGRQGFKGQYKEYVFSDEGLIQKEVKRILKKRLNAKTRIGCNYEIIEN